VNELFNSLKSLKEERNQRPKLLIAHTVKGKGVLSLETDPLCHIKSLKPAEIEKLVVGLE
jgi:transketolase